MSILEGVPQLPKIKEGGEEGKEGERKEGKEEGKEKGGISINYYGVVSLGYIIKKKQPVRGCQPARKLS